MKEEKRKWTSPEVHRYGTFEDATKSCTDKKAGAADGFWMNGVDVGCTAS